MHPIALETPTRKLGNSAGFAALALFFTAGVLISFVAWLKQAREGLGVTGLNSYITWGIYIVNFEFLVGLATGTMLVAAFGYAFRIRRIRPIARLSAVIALLSLLFAGMSIVTSMGRPDRAWTIMISGRLGSPLVWDVAVISISTVLFGAMVHLAMRPDLLRTAHDQPRVAWIAKAVAFWRTDGSPESFEKDERLLRGLAFVAIPWAIVLHSVTAWIFGIVKARPAWHSSLLAPLYVVTAIVSGLALILFLALLLNRVLKAKIPQKGIQTLALALAVGVPFLAYFLFAEMLTVTFQGGVPEEAVVFEEMMNGQFAWVFWFNLVAGLVLPIIVLVVPKLRSNHLLLGGASLLVLTGVYAQRFNLVVIPQLHKLLPHAPGAYSPTWVELALTLGAFAGIGLGVMLFARLVPLTQEEEPRVVGR